MKTVPPNGSRDARRHGDRLVAAERTTAVAGRAPCRTAGALQSLLEDAHVVFFPEPAHDGHDWGFCSPAPVRDRLVAAFRDHPVEGTRRFVLPYQKARSESKFYFDKWQPTDSPPPTYATETFPLWTTPDTCPG